MSNIKGVFIFLSDGTQEPIDVGSMIVEVNDKGLNKIQKRWRNPKLNLYLLPEDVINTYPVQVLYKLTGLIAIVKWIEANRPEILKEYSDYVKNQNGQ